MNQSTDIDARDLREMFSRLTDRLDKITDRLDTLRDEVRDFREETRISITKLEGKIEKLDDRTTLGFWQFIIRGVVLTLIVGTGAYLLPLIAEYIHKLPTL